MGLWQVVWRLVCVEVKKVTDSQIAEFVNSLPNNILLDSYFIEGHGL